ncbi:jerky protein homolog-like [Oscarella lobularis]|uniref:jerky protein homolog-like n=1 Tax=Oscarella lobularis TaxID=121494 RepID=UPI003313E8AC
MSRPAKSMKMGINEELDDAVFMWFNQKRQQGIPVSGPLLCEKAKQLHEKMGKTDTFLATSGWQTKFCKRYGIREISLQGEKASADEKAACEFVEKFQKFISEEKYSLDQIFNLDETGLQFRLLPEKTLAGAFEKSAAGRKKAKDRVTLAACSNASGSIFLPLLMIGKSNKPRCYRQLDMKLLPYLYRGQKKAWMTSELFSHWFHTYFVVNVREHLQELGFEKRAVLLLDNCSAHFCEKELMSSDGKIVVKYFPPNVTSIIQPMDQGVLESMKRRYRKKLLSKFLLEDEEGVPIPTFLKTVDMKVVGDMVAASWDEITMTTIRKSWRKIIPLTQDEDDFDSNNDDSDDDDGAEVLELSELAKNSSAPLDPKDIFDWLRTRDGNAETVLTDEEIIAKVQEGEHDIEPDESDDSDDERVTISHAEDSKMFEGCLAWLEQQPEANANNLRVLRTLRDLADDNRMKSLKQTEIERFFAK